MPYIITTAPDVYILQLDRHAKTAVTEAVSVRSVAGTTFPRLRLLNLRYLLDRLLQQITNMLALPPYMRSLIVSKIQENVDDPTYDAAAEFLNMQTEAQALVDWIETNYPTNADGGQATYDINGNPLTFTLTAPQITALQTSIDNFTTTISFG